MKRSRSAMRCTLLVFGSPWLSTVCLAAQAPKFSVQVLEPLPGGVSALVNAVNNAGEAVGRAGDDSACVNNCAVIWHDVTPTVLAMGANLETGGGEAISINNSGQVVGNTSTDAVDYANNLAVIWNNGTPSLLPNPSPAYTHNYVSSVNDAGTVVGFASIPGGYGYEAVEWTGLTPTVLETDSNCGGFTTGINRDGTVVGYSVCGNLWPLTDGAIVWRDTAATLLGNGKPLAVNNAGLMVGGNILGISGWNGATAWVKGILTDLQVLPGATQNHNSHATAVNDRGLIVGTAQVSAETPPGKTTYHALLWSSVNAAPQDLNDLISVATAKKYLLTEATGINDSCSIVVNGFQITDTVNTVAFLLKPLDPSNCSNGEL